MTLGDYLELAKVTFPSAVPFLERKIAEQGANEEVIADETQMLLLLASIAEEDA